MTDNIFLGKLTSFRTPESGTVSHYNPIDIIHYTLSTRGYLTIDAQALSGVWDFNLFSQIYYGLALNVRYTGHAVLERDDYAYYAQANDPDTTGFWSYAMGFSVDYAPTVVVQPFNSHGINASIARGNSQTININSIFDESDPTNKFSVSLTTPQYGSISLHGVENDQFRNITASELRQIVVHAEGTTDDRLRIVITSEDQHTFGEPATLVYYISNAKPYVTATSKSERTGTEINFSSLITAHDSNPGDVDTLTFKISSTYTDDPRTPENDGGYFALNGGRIEIGAAGQTVTAADLKNLTFHFSDSAGINHITIVATDGGGESSAPAHLDLTAINQAPKVIADKTSNALDFGQTVNVETLIDFSDPDGDENNLKFEVIDKTTKVGSGHLTVDGIAVPASQQNALISIDELSRLVFQPGAGGVEDTLQIRAFDGIDYSDPVTLTIKAAAFRDVTVTKLYTELMKFADAAYPSTFEPESKSDYQELMSRWQPLSGGQIGLDGGDGTLGSGRLSAQGRYENGNAQATVAVGKVNGVATLVVAFRGTDTADGYSEEGSDKLDWPASRIGYAAQSYFEKFASLTFSLENYISTNGIGQVFIAGHSLGGEAAQLFTKQLITEENTGNLPTIKIETATDGAPGISGGSSIGDPLVMFVNTADAVPKAGTTLGGNSFGGKLVYLTNPNDTALYSIAEHSKYQYRDMVSKLEDFLAQHSEEPNFLKSRPSEANSASHDPAYVVMGGLDVPQGAHVPLFQSGTIPGIIMGPSIERKNSELLIGTSGSDKIVGYGGSDHLWGLAGPDTFYLLDGSPTAYAGSDSDTFEVRLGTAATIVETENGTPFDEIFLKARTSATSIARLAASLIPSSELETANAVIDLTRLTYAKSGADLLLGYTESDGSVTSVRIKDMATSTHQVEQLLFDVISSGAKKTAHVSLVDLWNQATSNDQTVATVPVGSGLTIQSSSTTVAGGALSGADISYDSNFLSVVNVTHPASIAPHSYTFRVDGSSLSANGRYLVFATDEQNALDHNSLSLMANEQLVLRDLQTGQSQLISTNVSGTALNGSIWLQSPTSNFAERHIGSLSEDNQRLVFIGNPTDNGWISPVEPTDIGFSDPNRPGHFLPEYLPNIFVKNLATGRVNLVSYDINGNSLPVHDLILGGISPDGQYVSFATKANNVVAGDNDDSQDIFVRDLSVLGALRVTTTIDNHSPDGPSDPVQFSQDGRYLVFTSLASNLVAGDTNSTLDVFVRDLQLQRTELISIASDGHQGTYQPGGFAGTGTRYAPSDAPSISGDGRSVVFESLATDLVSNDTNAAMDIFIKDRETGDLSMISENAAGGSYSPVISQDGRFVIYSTQLPQDQFQGQRIPMVYDIATGLRQSFGVIGEEALSISDDGKILTYGVPGSSQTLVALANPLYTADVNWRPSVTTVDQQIGANSTVSGASLFRATDRNGDNTITAFEFQDLGAAAGSGQFLYHGVSQSNAVFQVAASDLSALRYIGGTDGTVDGITVQAYDGKSWSPLSRFDIASVALTTPELQRESLAPDLLGGDGDTQRSSLSADGRFLAFESQADNLVPGDTAGQQDIFLRDLQSGQTTRFSLGLGGSEADNFSSAPSLSASGNQIVFESWADNLVAGDVNGVRDVFIYDTTAASLRRVSEMGGTGGNGDSFDPHLSADGTEVAFASVATNLAANDGNAYSDVFVSSSSGAGIIRASVGVSGVEGNGDSWAPRLTATGGQVAFSSYASNLVTADTNNSADIFLKDLSTGALQRISTTSTDLQADGDSYLLSITPDGRNILFESWADNLTNGDANGTADIFLKNLATGAVSRVSETAAGIGGNDRSFNAFISDDARFVVFESDASNLGSIDDDNATDVFVKDLVTGAIIQVSKDILGRDISNNVAATAISGDGRYISFATGAAGVTFDDTGTVVDSFVIPNPLFFQTPKVIAQPSYLVDRGASLTSADLVSITAGNQGAVQEVEIYDATSAALSGNFVVSGNVLGPGFHLLSSAQLSSLSFVAGTAQDRSISDTLAMRAYDGTMWGTWTNFTVTTKYNEVPVVTGTGVSVERGGSVLIEPLVNVSDANGDAIVKYEVTDNTPGVGTGRLTLDGAVVAGGVPLELSPEQFARLKFVAAANVSSPINDVVSVRASDGIGWSSPQLFSFQSTPGNTAPVVQVKDLVLLSGQDISVSQIFSAFDRNNDPLATIELRDHNRAADSGALFIGGVRQAEGNTPDGSATSITMTAAQAGSARFIAGSIADGTIVDQLDIRVSDGIAWSDWASFNITTSTVNAAPVIAPQSVTLQQGEAVSAISLFAFSDLNGETPAVFSARTGTGVGGSWSLDGVTLSPASDGTITAMWSSIDQLHYTPSSFAAPSVSTIQLRVSDGKDWGAWTDVPVNLTPGNSAPIVIATDHTLVRSESISASDIVAVSDRNGDMITKYEIDDLNAANGSAHWELDGQTIIGETELSSLQFDRLLLQGGSSVSSIQDQMSVRAYDGQAWSDWTAFTLTSTGGNVVPVITASMLSVLPAAHVHVTNALQIYDQNNDLMTRYEIFGDGSAGAADRILYDGQPVSDSSTQPFAFTDLSKLELVGAAASSTETFELRAFDGNGWSQFSQLQLNTSVDAPREPVVLTGSDQSNTLIGHEQDTVLANGGDDVIELDGTPGSVDGGPGTDTVRVLANSFVSLSDSNVKNVELFEVQNHAFLDASGMSTAVHVHTLTTSGSAAAVTGGAASDTLIGNAGDDLLDGSAGGDQMSGELGNDTYIVDDILDNVIENVGEGTDAVLTTLAAYTLGQNIENLVFTDNASHTGVGNGLANTIIGGTGIDSLIGGLGNDTYVVNNVGDLVIESANQGNDLINASVNYTLSANVEALVLVEGAGPIAGLGNGAANYLQGNSDNNALDGGAGADYLVGGAGNDTYTVDNAGDAVVENVNEGNDVVHASIDYTIGANIESLILDGTTVNGAGNGTDNAMIGNDADNIIDGRSGADFMVGGKGNDIYFVDNAGDAIVENANEGNDIVHASIDYTIGANIESLILDGATINGAGNSADNAIIGNDSDNIINGGAGADFMVGGKGNDIYFVDNAGDAIIENPGEGNDIVHASIDYTIGANIESLILDGATVNGAGNSTDNAIIGNDADNIIDGRGGSDFMVGGKGNDIYFVDNASDAIVENANEGNDQVFTSVDFVLPSNVEQIALIESAGAINAIANDGDNVLIGNSSANVLQGHAGNDVISGGGGNDVLDGGTGIDVMSGGAGDDIYYVDNQQDSVLETSNGGSDTVRASISYLLPADVENLLLLGTGDINGIGNNLANEMTGNSGNNILDGGGGLDFLTGNGGNDTFQFKSGEASGDVIADFAGNGAAVGDSLLFIGFGTAAQGATFTEIGATNQWQIHSGLDSHNEVIILQNNASVHASDYLFV